MKHMGMVVPEVGFLKKGGLTAGDEAKLLSAGWGHEIT